MSQAKALLRLPPLPSIKDIIQLYKLRALRQLSQNFLFDERVINKIVNCAGKIQGCDVCEVGPGPGGITRSIIRKGADRLVLIEKDKRFLPSLELLSEASSCDVQIILGDVLSFNMENIFNEDKKCSWLDRAPNIHIIGNLPFSVSTPLIIKWLRAISYRENAWKYGRVRLTLTFQKEFADRVVAPISTPQRCRLSVMCQNWCAVSSNLVIPGHVFVPKPDVDVGVVRFTPLKFPVIPLPFELVEKVARCLFSSRQKYCFKGLGTLYPEPVREQLVSDMLEKAEIKPETRPYQLTVEEIGRICYAYKEVCGKNTALFKYNHRQSKVYEESLEDSEEEFNEKLYASS